MPARDVLGSIALLLLALSGAAQGALINLPPLDIKCARHGSLEGFG